MHVHAHTCRYASTKQRGGESIAGSRVGVVQWSVCSECSGGAEGLLEGLAGRGGSGRKVRVQTLPL